MLTPSLRNVRISNYNKQLLDYKSSKLDKCNDKKCIVTLGDSHAPRD